MLNILLADDHPVFRKGLAALLVETYRDCLIAEARNGREAIEMVGSTGFDIVLLDIDMPEQSGFEVLHFINAYNIPTRPVILTLHRDELFFNEAFDRGAKGFLLKEDSASEIVECLESVQQNIPFVSRKLVPLLANRKQFAQKMTALNGALSSLTAAELSTLRLVAENKTSREIAGLLFVTEKSVENYRSRICRKLNLAGGTNALYRWAMDHQAFISRLRKK